MAGPQLRILQGFGAGYCLDIEDKAVTIGRDPGCDLQIGDTKASRAHAEIRNDDGRWRLNDLGSSNGTWQDDGQVETAVLEDGDTFRIGSTIMRFELDADNWNEKEEWGSHISGLEGGTELLSPSRVQDRRTLERANDYLVLLHDIVCRAAGVNGREELFELLDDAAADALDGDRCAVFLPTGTGWGLWPPHERRLRARFGATPFARTLLMEAKLRRKPLLCTDKGDIDPSVSMVQAGTRSAMVAPLRVGEHIHALLYVDRLEKTDPFGRTDLEFLAAVGNQLAVRLENVTQMDELRAEVERLQENVEEPPIPIIGADPSMGKVRDFVDRFAVTSSPAVIIGESGTGKHYIARAIHRASDRSAKPFQVLNPGGGDSQQAAAVLFGYAKGALEGATESRPGMVELADGGTLFVADPGELGEVIQAGLLRLIEEGIVQRQGDPAVRKVDVRVILANGRPLQEEMAEGRLRTELFHVLEPHGIRLPPLRDRGGDVDLLLDHFLDDCAKRLDQPRKTPSPECRTQLLRHPWPGNVRQLRNCVERACIMATGHQIGVEDLPESLMDQEGVTFQAPICPLADVERQHILHVLDHCGGNKKATAEVLGIDRSTLYAKLRQYGAH